MSRPGSDAPTLVTSHPLSSSPPDSPTSLSPPRSPATHCRLSRQLLLSGPLRSLAPFSPPYLPRRGALLASTPSHLPLPPPWISRGTPRAPYRGDASRGIVSDLK
ncbi:hypothetical protein BC834DRAFT_977122 [Gloeopeniophorella convolvens]|nr:hypothetical protein BC834DRAFT_977122 [Gloeopeniophorella convolvens]